MTSSTAPRPSHLVELADGRVLTVDDTGPANGPAVLLLHSAPGSRLLDPDPAVTVEAGVRLLTVDRPGYGASSPLAEGVVPSVGAHADDLVAVLDHLGVDDVAVVGWSSGGRHALALAARHPARVRRVALVGTPAPDDDVPWIQDEHRPMLAQLRADPAAGVLGLAQAFAPIAEDPGLYLNQVGDGPADLRFRDEQPVLAARAQAMLVEAFRPGVRGVATDIVACNVVDAGVDPSAVGVPVALFYGDGDVAVPLEHGRYWEARLGDAVLYVAAGDGHFLLLTRWGEVLAAVA